jgi:hypothetical protein|tara:strand:+ start:264 stop:1265 length:1002 start_codon:yes stop_codon:yes gene_type:complete
VNFKNIKSKTFASIDTKSCKEITEFIRNNYLKEKDCRFLPEKSNILPYFTATQTQSIWSVYYESANVQNKIEISTEIKIAGFISSRPMKVKMKDIVLSVCYVDYLCVDKFKRKKGIAPQLIQTHNYNQRRMNKETKVCLFKREQELTGIVPIVAYTTYGFCMKSWEKPLCLRINYNKLQITPTNFFFFWNFLKTCAYHFDVFATCEAHSLLSLIKSDNVFIYVVIINDVMKSAYFYRKSCTFIEENLEAVSCFASINNGLSDDVFVHAFKETLWDICDKKRFAYAVIENISHTETIIKSLLKRNEAEIQSPTAYFFYNYIHATVKASKSIFIC